MKRHHSTRYLPLLGEFVAALAMLAMLILSFAPVTPANSILSSATGSEIAVQSSWCGGPVEGGRVAHFGACHACRFDPAQVPPPPCVAEPAFAGLVDAPLVEADIRFVPVEIRLSNGSRAPPVAV